MAVDCGDVAALVLLDLSAAFDTVCVLCKPLQLTFSLDGHVLAWFCSYLSTIQYNTMSISRAP